jgi:hypothetical protein
MSALNFDETVENKVMYRALILSTFLMVGLIFVNLGVRFRGIHLICYLWVLVMMVVLFVNNTAKATTYLRCLFWPLLFEATYIFVKDNNNREKSMVRFFYLIGGMGLYFFIYAMLIKNFYTQSNMIYFFILTVPILLLTENRMRRGFVLVVSTVLAMVSMKRSMILTVAVFWLVYYVNNALRNQAHRWRTIVLAIVMPFVAYFAFNYIDQLSKGYFSSRFMMEDMSNGRNDIYEMTWAMQLQSSTTQWWFGHGDDAVRHNSERVISAHNEWMEILYDYGAIVLLLYLGLWIGLIKRWFFHYKTMSKYLTAYTLSLCIFAVMSMVSQLVLYVSYFLYLVMFWATVEALCDTEFREYKVKKTRHFA